MIDLNKKLNKKNFYLEDAETIDEYIDFVLKIGDEFYYKNILYMIDVWDGDDWAIQTNSDQNSDAVKWDKYYFKRNKEDFIIALENFKLHDGTTLYEAMTKKGYSKFFLYDKNIKY